MTIHELRMTMIGIAVAFEQADAPAVGVRLRGLPDPITEQTRQLWLDRLRDATSIAIDCGAVAGRRMAELHGMLRDDAAEKYAAWKRVGRAIDMFAPAIRQAIAPVQDAAETATVAA